MPPNRKAVQCLVTTDVASAFVRTSKFQPIASHHESAHESAEVSAVPNSKPAESEDARASDTSDSKAQSLPVSDVGSPKQAVIQQILEEERIRQQFSVDHVIEVNRHAGKTETQITQQAADVDAGDAYWDMSASKESELRGVHLVQPSKTETSYWDWPTQSKQEEKDATIRSILHDEKVRELLSAQTLEKQLLREAFDLIREPKPAALNDAYWEWKTAPIDDDSEDWSVGRRENLIQKILEAEKIRLQFSVATMEEQLTRGLVSDAHVINDADAVSNSDYWANF